MQPKWFSQTGLKVRTNCRLGYVAYLGIGLPQDKLCNNTCLKERNDRSILCAALGWDQDAWPCAGNNNGQELDRCMANCWPTNQLQTERPSGGLPYNSAEGDKCFSEFIQRASDGWLLYSNKLEWENCLITTRH